MSIFAILIVGFLVGGLTGLFGIGGFTFYVPLLLVMYTNEVPAGLLIPAVLCNAFIVSGFNCMVAWFYYREHGTVNLEVAAPLVKGAAVGMLVALCLTLGIGLIAYADIFFGIFLLVAGGYVAWKYFDHTPDWELKKDKLPAFGLLGGALTGIIGFNGASYFTPVLRHVGLSMRQSIATAQLPSLVVCTIGATVLAAYGLYSGHNLLDFGTIVALAVASSLGTVLTVRYKPRTDKSILTTGLVTIYILGGMVLIFKMPTELATYALARANAQQVLAEAWPPSATPPVAVAPPVAAPAPTKKVTSKQKKSDKKTKPKSPPQPTENPQPTTKPR